MRYTVCGKNEVLGHAPGKAFEADLDHVTEVRLIAGGHIARLADIEPKTDTTFHFRPSQEA